MKRVGNVRPRPGASPELAANQLLLTFPTDGGYTLADVSALAVRCGVSLHDVAVAATIHALAPYQWEGIPLSVEALGLSPHRPPVAPRQPEPHEMKTLVRGADGTFNIPLPPGKIILKNDKRMKGGVRIIRTQRCTAYVFAGDMGRYGYWSKVGITDDISGRADAIRLSISKLSVSLVAWWSFTSLRGARRLERMAIRRLREECACTFPEDWFPIHPSKAVNLVASLAEELGSVPDGAADCSAVAEGNLQWRPMQ